MDKILFKEIQRNAILIVVASVFAVFFGILVIVQVIMGKPIGNHPAPNGLLIAFFVVCGLSIIFFSKQKLILVITEKQISISYGLLTSEIKINNADINSIKIRKYDALKEFLGWGVRYNENESCFTVSGDNALEIELVSGEKFLIGTQKPDEIMLTIADLLHGSQP